MNNENIIQDHTSRDHALLSPSGSHRWLNCTPSARLEDGLNKVDKGSAASEEGTVAHELAEYALTKFLTGEYIPLIDELPVPKEIEENKYFSGEMVDYITEYVIFCTDIYDRLASEGKMVSMTLEQKFDLRNYVQECFGSCDCKISTEDEIYVIDLKYGKGIKVEAEKNSQLMMYGLGMLETLSASERAKIKTVKMYIAQVRLESFPEFIMSKADLVHWGIHELRVKAKIAWNGEGKQVVGSHCKFCKFKAMCKAQKDMVINEFESHEEVKAITLTELSEVLNKLDAITDWVSAVKEYAFASLSQGHTVEGWKLVEGRSQRVINDVEEAVKRLNEVGFPSDLLFNKKLKGIGDLERLAGKKILAEVLKDVIIKPNGLPTLAPESDKRPALENALNDFDKL